MLRRLLKSALARRKVGAAQAAPQAAETTPADASASKLELLSRLASLASGRTLQVTGKEAPGDAAAGAERAELPIERIVAHAATLRRDVLAAETEARVASFVPAFAAAERDARGLNAFLFHVDLPAGSAIDYVDAKFVPQHFDYLDILRRCIERLRSHCPDATVILVTARGAHG